MRLHSYASEIGFLTLLIHCLELTVIMTIRREQGRPTTPKRILARPMFCSCSHINSKHRNVQQEMLDVQDRPHLELSYQCE